MAAGGRLDPRARVLALALAGVIALGAATAAAPASAPPRGPSVLGCATDGSVERPTAADEAYFYALADRAAAYYAATTGVPVRSGRNWFLLRRGDTQGSTAATCGLDERLARASARPARWCEIDFLAGLRLTPGAIAHEVFHCVQLQAMGSDARFEALVHSRKWLIEGGAQFAAVSFLRARVPGYRGDANYLFAQRRDCAGWVSRPTRPLFARDYDAIGLFATIELAGGRPLARMAAALRAPSDAAAYAAATAGARSATVDRWASSTSLSTTRGGGWTLRGSVCDPAEIARPTPQPLPAGPLSVPAYTGELLSVPVAASSGADAPAYVVVATRSSASGSLRFNGGGTDVLVPDAGQPTYVCTSADRCACPSQDVASPPPAPLAQLGGNPSPVYVAAAGGQRGLSAQIQEISRSSWQADYCRPPLGVTVSGTFNGTAFTSPMYALAGAAGSTAISCQPDSGRSYPAVIFTATGDVVVPGQSEDGPNLVFVSVGADAVPLGATAQLGNMAQYPVYLSAQLTHSAAPGGPEDFGGLSGTVGATSSSVAINATADNLSGAALTFSGTFTC